MVEYKPHVWRVNVREQTRKHEPVTKEDNRLPENNAIFDVSGEVLDHIFDGIE